MTPAPSTEYTFLSFRTQRLRPLSYSKAHVILIAFSIDTPDSLENVTVKVSKTLLCWQLNPVRSIATFT